MYFSGRSVDGISHLLRHFRQVLSFEKSSEHRNLSVGVGGSTLLNYAMNWRWAELHAADMFELPRIPIGPKPGNHWCTKLVHLNNGRSVNWRWKKVRCKSAQTICIKHYWDCRLFVSGTFFLCKKGRQNSLLLAVFLVVENGHFKFCYRKRSKISPKSDFLVAAWGVEILGNYQW